MYVYSYLSWIYVNLKTLQICIKKYRKIFFNFVMTYAGSDCKIVDFFSIQTNYSEDRAGIFKPLWRPGIDAKASIPPAYVAWRAGTITLFLLGA